MNRFRRIIGATLFFVVTIAIAAVTAAPFWYFGHILFGCIVWILPGIMPFGVCTAIVLKAYVWDNDDDDDNDDEEEDDPQPEPSKGNRITSFFSSN